MGSLDRRVPVAGASLLALVGGIPALPPETSPILFAAIPASFVWLVRTTINHARSFEDLIRRIETLETMLNEVAGQQLIGFQSTHPSRGKSVGGRTGAETVAAVVFAAMIALAACAYLLFEPTRAFDPLPVVGLIYVTTVAMYVILLVCDWRRYRYQRQETAV